MKISFQIFLILIYQTVSEELHSDKDAFCKKENLENDPNLSKYFRLMTNYKATFFCISARRSKFQKICLAV